MSDSGYSKFSIRDYPVKFPITTFDTDIEARWEAIYRFAECMYGISPPNSDDKSIEIPNFPEMPNSFYRWVNFSRQLMSDVGFRFFDFTPRFDKELDHFVVANFNQFGQWGIRSSEVGTEDPPVDAFQFVQSKKKFVFRKMSRVNSLSHWVLELLIEHGSIQHIGATLTAPTQFVRELRHECPVSDRIGNIFLTGGDDWYATISAGPGPFGSSKNVILRYKETTDRSRIPVFTWEQ